MSSLLITEVKIKKKKKSLSQKFLKPKNKIFKEDELKNLFEKKNNKKEKEKIKKEEKNNEEKKKQKSYFLIKNEKQFSKAKKELMNYLIDEQSKYTNLDNAIEYYEKQIEDFQKKMNNNDILIKKKKTILKAINQQFNDILLNNLKLKKNDKIKEKEDEKINLEIQIQTFIQAIEIYKNIKSELEIENMNLKKNLHNEFIESLTIKKQYEKYKLIKLKIDNEEKAQNHLFNTMMNFNIKSKLMFDEDENKKKNILAKEEFSLKDLKQNIKKNEDYIHKLEKIILKKKKILPFEKMKNNKIFQDNRILRKETVQNYLKLNLIKKYLKLKDLIQVVNHVKNQNLIFLSKYNKFNRMLNNLTNLKQEISKNQNEIKTIHELIKEKLQNIKLFYDEPELINKIVDINRIKQSNILSKEYAYKKEEIIKDIIRFIDRNNIQCEKMIQSILIFNMRIKEKSISKKDLDKIFNLFNNKNNIDLSKFTSTKPYLINDYKLICKIILQFFRSFNYIYCNFIIDIIIQASNIEEKIREKTKIKNQKNNKNLNSESINKSKINQIEIYLFSDLSKEIEEEEKEKKKQYQEFISKQGKKIDNKQIKQELLKQNISKEINTMLDEGIDIEVLLERYLTFLRKKNEEENKIIKKNKFEYESLREKKRNEKKKKKYDKEIKKIREKRLLFSRLKMKFFLNISNYTSDLVKHDDWYKKNKTKYNIDIRLKNRTKNTKNILSELLQEYNRNKVQKKFNKSMNEVFKKIVRKGKAERAIFFPKQKNEFEEIQVLDNTFIDEDEYNKSPDIIKEKKIVKIEKNYFGYKSGLNKNKRNKSFKTMFDLNKINVELFHKKSSIENYKDFNTIQNEFQKKLNMRIYSPIVSFFNKKENEKNIKLKNTFSSNSIIPTNNTNNDNNKFHNKKFHTLVDNRELSVKNLGFRKRNTSQIYKYKSQDGFPRINSGNINVNITTE